MGAALAFEQVAVWPGTLLRLRTGYGHKKRNNQNQEEDGNF